MNAAWLYVPPHVARVDVLAWLEDAELTVSLSWLDVRAADPDAPAPSAWARGRVTARA